MALMVRRARYKSVGVAGVVSKQGRCLCRRVSCPKRGRCLRRRCNRGVVCLDEGLVPLWSLRAGSLTDNDRGQVIDGRVKGVAPL